MKNFKNLPFTVVCGILFSLTLLFAQCTSKESTEKDQGSSGVAEQGKKVLIEVNGEPIYQHEIEKKLNNLKKRFTPLVSEAEKLDSGALFDTAAKNLIQDKVLRQEAKKRKIFVTDSEVDSVVKHRISGYSPELLQKLLRENGTTERDWRRDVARRLLLRKLSKQVVGKSLTVTDEEIQEYYKENLDQFVFPLKVRALHILVLTKDKAFEIHDAIKKGADFGELAKTHSVAPEAKGGGDLGFFSVGQLPDEFEQVIFALNVGEVSEVVVTPYGFHIFTLIEKRTPVKKKSNLAVRMIRKRLLDKKRDQTYKSWVNMLLDRAEVMYADNWKSNNQEENSNE